MRASRLLRILLILQNRGRVSTLQLATELEVARRTVMRDIDALSEAGLPIVVHRGSMGGVELGFEYRSRLVGLDASEAEALGVILALPKNSLAELGITSAASQACDKLVESLPETVRQRVMQAQRRFQFVPVPAAPKDPRIS
ncbi:MAG: HTH domain-containing protein, partial [Usitatibacteraceae bacterium]